MVACASGVYRKEENIEAAIYNKWLREIFENEREFQLYQTQYLASSILVALTRNTDVVLEIHKKLIHLCFPWEDIGVQKNEDTLREEAIQKYKDTQERIKDIKQDIGVNEVFAKWEDPLSNTEIKQ
jgi:isopropylmalate/homocitrate/citramalate synthase